MSIAIIAKAKATDAPTASISILDSVANPDYVTATTTVGNNNTRDARRLQQVGDDRWQSGL